MKVLQYLPLCDCLVPTVNCKFNYNAVTVWLLFFSVRIMSAVPYGLSKVVMKLMKN